MLSWQSSLETLNTESPQKIRCDAYGGLCQRAWVEIDLEALADNITQIKSLLSPKTSLMAVVKADAYGHGATMVAQIALASGANCLGVATLPEGIELRQSGITAPILILGAIHTPEQVKAIVDWELQPTLCTPKQALVFAEVLSKLNQSLPIHIKIDTGMSRLGIPWQEAAEFVQLIRGLPPLEIASIYSHLATADHPDQTLLKKQHQCFEKAIEEIKSLGITLPPLHLANSAATLGYKELHYDMVRVGLATYGLYPAPHLSTVIPLKPVLQVKARITQIKTISPGTGVSYGHQFIAQRETQIAVVGIGYADGIPRHLSQQINVLIKGHFVPQIGTITMDQMMLDVTDIPVEVGEVVTLLGGENETAISADDWAMKLGTISWEILCSFKHRLPRIAVQKIKKT